MPHHLAGRRDHGDATRDERRYANVSCRVHGQAVESLVARKPAHETSAVRRWIRMLARPAGFLQVEEAVVIELAEAGQLPGRKLGSAWRFSREALVAWLSQPESKR